MNAQTSTKRREPSKYLKDADGKTICSCGCGQHPKPPRRNWFSDACVDAWKERNDPAHIRLMVLKRDKGICAVCGCDADAEYRRFWMARKEVARLVSRLEANFRHNFDWNDRDRRWHWRGEPEISIQERKRERERLMQKFTADMRAWTSGRVSGWDADHIIPVVEGGGGCGLKNYRTLCHPCHKAATAELARRRAEARRGTKTEEPSLL